MMLVMISTGRFFNIAGADIMSDVASAFVCWPDVAASNLWG
jgi:hypothetical protein